MEKKSAQDFIFGRVIGEGELKKEILRLACSKRDVF
jgi:hypothetical protein